MVDQTKAGIEGSGPLVNAPPAVSFTVDLEDHRQPGEEVDTRYPVLTKNILEVCAASGITGTFFVLGRLAEDEPGLIRDIAAQGHEVALHSWDHTPLPQTTPDAFRQDTLRGKKLLEDLTGTAVVGYRAPVFSLVAGTAWAPEILAELGFAYSSSVLPAWNPLFGWPEAPAGPFQWPSGLVELPCPVLGATIGGRSLALPFLGGVYTRVLPLAVTSRLLARRSRGADGGSAEALWMYVHPYDFDDDEPYWQVPDLGPVGSRLLWLNRSRMVHRITELVAPNPGDPLRLVAERIGAALAVFDPASTPTRSTTSPTPTTPPPSSSESPRQ